MRYLASARSFLCSAILLARVCDGSDCLFEDLPDASTSVRERTTRPRVKDDRGIRSAVQTRSVASEIHAGQDAESGQRVTDAR